MLHRLIDQYEAILFDLCDTFMFGVDRYGPEHDLAATYYELGGNAIPHAVADRILRQTVERILGAYQDPAFVENFPSVRELLLQDPHVEDLPDREQGILERVIAVHETGRVPGAHAAVLRQLARSHRLGIVSNIWSRPPVFLEQIHEAGLENVFATKIFSSDLGVLKPCPRIFEKALEELGCEPRQTLFVGDNAVADIFGAAKVGIDGVWINARVKSFPVDDIRPKAVIECITRLQEVRA